MKPTSEILSTSLEEFEAAHVALDKARRSAVVKVPKATLAALLADHGKMAGMLGLQEAAPAKGKRIAMEEKRDDSVQGG